MTEIFSYRLGAIVESVDANAHALSKDGSLCAPHTQVLMADKLNSSSAVLSSCEPPPARRTRGIFTYSGGGL